MDALREGGGGEREVKRCSELRQKQTIQELGACLNLHDRYEVSVQKGKYSLTQRTRHD